METLRDCHFDASFLVCDLRYALEKCTEENESEVAECLHQAKLLKQRIAELIAKSR